MRAGSMSAMVIDLPLPSRSRANDFDPALDGLLGLGGLGVAGRLDELQHFARLMQTQGATVEPTRMLFDMPYADDCLAWALASPCAPLCQLAQRLHAQYQQAGHWLGLH